MQHGFCYPVLISASIFEYLYAAVITQSSGVLCRFKPVAEQEAFPATFTCKSGMYMGIMDVPAWAEMTRTATNPSLPGACYSCEPLRGPVYGSKTIYAYGGEQSEHAS